MCNRVDGHIKLTAIRCDNRICGPSLLILSKKIIGTNALLFGKNYYASLCHTLLIRHMFLECKRTPIDSSFLYNVHINISSNGTSVKNLALVGTFTFTRVNCFSTNFGFHFIKHKFFCCSSFCDFSSKITNMRKVKIYLITFSLTVSFCSVSNS